MPFEKNMRITLILLFFGLIISCKEKEKPTKLPIKLVQDEKVEMEYYNPEFKLDSKSELKTDGFYEVKEIFGTHTIDSKNYYTNKPKYGFVHFFDNGLCRIGLWNGIRKNSSDVKKDFEDGGAYVFG